MSEGQQYAAGSVHLSAQLTHMLGASAGALLRKLHYLLLSAGTLYNAMRTSWTNNACCIHATQHNQPELLEAMHPTATWQKLLRC